MSFEGMLTMKATIQRATNSTSDGFGAPISTWATIATVACRIESGSSQELMKDVTEVTGVYRIFLQYGTELFEKDQVVCNGTTYNVRSVSPDPGGVAHHQEALLEVIK